MENKTPAEKLPAITDGSEKIEVSQKPCLAAESTKNAESEITNQNVPREGLSRKKNLILIKHEKVLTPQVLWSQTHSEVRIKIVVQNVQDYSLECTETNMAFRCFVGEKLYAFDLKLYGAINPQMTKLTLKAFHAIVILKKLVSPYWPRLHRDEGKHRWVNLDVENLTVKDDEIANRIKSVKRDMKAGIFKESAENVKVCPFSDSENEEKDFESESESD